MTNEEMMEEMDGFLEVDLSRLRRAANSNEKISDEIQKKLGLVIDPFGIRPIEAWELELMHSMRPLVRDGDQQL